VTAPTLIGIAVVEHEGRYLVGERAGDVPLAGCAEFPGGKCRPGEEPSECARRECLEETNLHVRAERLLLRREFDYPHGRVDLRFWLCRPVRADDVAEMHGRFRWLPAHELESCRFPEANQPVVQMLARMSATE
jgi:8-oxo-dGTP diphosphatase